MRKIIILFLCLSISCSSKISKKYDYSDFSQNVKKFIQMYNRNIDDSKIEQIILFVNKYSIESNIDPKLVISLIARESSFKDNVVSKSGAIGLGQLLYSTAKDLGINNPFDIEENIKGTVKYLKKMMILFNDNIDLALASYKIGYKSVSEIIKSGSNLPKSTIDYINDIKNNYNKINLN
jgi:soluble lytic murein transglycosylase-like protein